MGKRGVAKAILFSDESLARLVNDLYASYLERDASGAELTKFTKQLKAGKSITAIEAKILGSVEFQRRINTISFRRSICRRSIGPRHWQN